MTRRPATAPPPRRTRHDEFRTRSSSLTPHPSSLRGGALAVELAVLLPFIALMFVVAVDFCRCFYVTQVVENCAYCGALYASGAARIDPTATDRTSAATAAAVTEGGALNPPVQAGDVGVTTGTTTATVTVNYSFRMVTSYLGGSGAMTITRTVTLPLAPRAPG